LPPKRCATGEPGCASGIEDRTLAGRARPLRRPYRGVRLLFQIQPMTLFAVQLLENNSSAARFAAFPFRAAARGGAR
jgi:hypothetical protein